MSAAKKLFRMINCTLLSLRETLAGFAISSLDGVELTKEGVIRNARVDLLLQLKVMELAMCMHFRLQISGWNQPGTHSNLRTNIFGAILRSLCQLKLSSNLLSTLEESSFLPSPRIKSSSAKAQMLFLGSWELAEATLLSELRCSMGFLKPVDHIQASIVILGSLIK